MNHATDVRVFKTTEDVAEAAAELFVRVAAESIEQRGLCHVALAGGSTPRRAYQRLAGADGRGVRWPRMRIWFGDERCAPPDHESSNYRMANDALLKHVNICPNCVHRIEGERPPAQAADEYESALRSEFSSPDDRFDLVLLGMGDDGHTASLFPGTAALHQRQRWCVPNVAPVAPTDRVTLTFPIINTARNVAFTVTGANKADVLARVLADPPNIDRLPSQGVKPTAGALTWLVDTPAAAKLPAKFVKDQNN